MGAQEPVGTPESYNTSAVASPSAYEKSSGAHDNQHDTLLGANSLGVKRIEAINAQLTFTQRVVLFISIFLLAYVFTLDGITRYTYQPIAADGFAEHSLSATVGVVRSVIAAAAQPVAAKVSNVFGRVELLYASIFFYVLGTIVEAATPDIAGLAAGAVLYQLGFTIVTLLCEVLIADLTSLRSRLFFSYIPAAPYLINAWVAAIVAKSTLATTTWRWGFGMYAIIFPVVALVLVANLLVANRRAAKSGQLASMLTPYQHLGPKRLVVELFWQLDIVGAILVILIFGLILVPLTIAGGFSEQWRSGSIIAPLVLGILCIPVFIWWERTCKYPLVPFHLLRDRGVWGALGVALFLNFAWTMQGDYLYSVLTVAFGQDVDGATRIATLYTFTSVLTGLLVGLVVRFVKRLKIFIVIGTVLFMVAFGLLIRFRGGDGSLSGIIGAEVLLGIAGGTFPYATQTSIQAATRHENVAVVTGLYLAIYNIGSALGNSVSGAYWTNTLPAKLAQGLGNATFAAEVYGSPFDFTAAYPWGTPEREIVVEAYRETQKVLCIIGLCLTIPLIVFGLCTRNPKLTAEQSLPNAEKYAPDSVSSDEETAVHK